MTSNISHFTIGLFFILLIGQQPIKTSESSNTILKNNQEKGWVSLFNGKDLEGWIVKIAGHPLGENYQNTFRVENGILSVRYDGYGDNFNNTFGGLYYDKKLSNYRLKIEYRFVGETALGAPEWGYRDSGVQFHSQPPSTIDIDGHNNTSYCTAPNVKRTFHGDQWVTLEIDIHNGKIKHFVNGEEIMSYSNPTYDPTNEVAKKFILNGDSAVNEGYISLQSNSHPIDFRKIEILKY